MNRFFAILTGCLWVAVSLLSIIHLFQPDIIPAMQVNHVGWLGWGMFFSTVLVLSRKFLLSSLLVFIVFFSFSFYTGPFLEPPADSIDHLIRTQKICGQESSFISRQNSGLWHYSMNSVLLCSDSKTAPGPKSILRKIDLLHALYCGIMAVTLFILARSSGLPSRWSFFSIICCWLFLGTNSFSYFRYYSLGPGCTSMIIYWLWTSVFFFRKKMEDLVWGILAGVLVLPVIWVNHYQEAAFLAFLIVIYIIFTLSRWIWKNDLQLQNSTNNIHGSLIRLFSICKYAKTSITAKKTVHLCSDKKILFIITLVFLFFILPQFALFQDTAAKILPNDYWPRILREDVLTWHGLQLAGTFWSSFRISNTLGFSGYAALGLGILLFIPALNLKAVPNQLRIIVLGILPFIGYCVPLLHFIWGSSVKYGVYYRLCYSSMFWLTIALFLFSLESRYIDFFRKIFQHKKSIIARQYCFLCITVMFLLSCHRTTPIYGKFDFLIVDSKSWWQEWQPLIESINKNSSDKPIYTDHITTAILYGVFGYPVHKQILLQFEHMLYRPLIISKMVKDADDNNYRCLINLHGFTPTWVPGETHHWKTEYADPSQFYKLSATTTNGEIESFLKTLPEKKCTVFR